MQTGIQKVSIRGKHMHKILVKREIAQKIKFIEVEAPEIAAKAQAGQFVILRLDEAGERFPLTLCDWNKKKGKITLVFLEVGVSTEKMGKLNEGDSILDICGPLGKPSEITKYPLVCIVGGGVGTAAAYPIARAFKEAGSKVISIIGAKTANMLILEDKMAEASNELVICTDDGSKGEKGFVSGALKKLIDSGYNFNAVYAIGPTVMMRAVAETTRPYKIKTVVSLNPIMVDGMGMCGACRVTVGGQTRFACTDGPDFDAHLVDFNELMKRQSCYCPEEKSVLQHYHEGCTCGK
jgi:ferredoxin--NADP+ reductase